MSIPSFAERREAWSSPPVDDVGYLPSAEMLEWSDEQLLETVAAAEHARYRGWRNWQDNWSTLFDYDRTVDLDVLDFGCGIGLEALQYARRGNRVTVADICETNVQLAQRVLALNGYPDAPGLVLEDGDLPVLVDSMHLIVAAGVIHHIPEPEPVLRDMSMWLKRDGQVRLMVYSDKAWRMATRQRPPRTPVEEHPAFSTFWQRWDPIGGYADWYDRRKLEERFGEWFTVEWCEPITRSGEYLGAVLVKR